MNYVRARAVHCNERLVKTCERRSSYFRVVCKGEQSVILSASEIIAPHIMSIPLISGRGRLFGPESNVVVTR